MAVELQARIYRCKLQYSRLARREVSFNTLPFTTLAAPNSSFAKLNVNATE